MSQPFKLYRLQQIDGQLDQIQLRLAKIEGALQNDAETRAAEERLKAAEDLLSEANKHLRKMEEEVRTQNIKVEQSEASLYGGKIHNPKELQDLEKESASIKRHISTLENQQLDMMLDVEEKESQVQAASADLESIRSKKATEFSLLRAEQANLEKDAGQLRNERQSAASTVSPEDQAIYDQLRKSRKGVAVAKVVDGCCAACGSELTPGLAQAAHSSSQLSRCTFCGRILYAG